MLYLHWIFGNHDTQSFEFSSWRFAVIIIKYSGFLLQHILSPRGFLLFHWPIYIPPGHASIVSKFRLFTNSLPLSQCKMYGRPNTLNTRSFDTWTTSFACFDLRGKKIWNVVKRSITWHTELTNSPAGVFRKSIRSIYPLGTQLGLRILFWPPSDLWEEIEKAEVISIGWVRMSPW